jgi:diguanylate cyclase (GGDEF)-like protein
VDGLKETNDAFGHAVGDYLIVTVADVLRRELRSTDGLARLGGDEFAVLLPEADRLAAEATIGRLVEAVRGEERSVDGRTLRMTVSAGMTLIDPVTGNGRPDPVGLTAAADRAMNRVKANGGDGYAVADPIPAARAH